MLLTIFGLHKRIPNSRTQLRRKTLNPEQIAPKLLWLDPISVLQIVSNGIYRSIEHRATVNSRKERMSIATFYSPKLEGDMGPAPSLITPQTPALFRRIGVVDYFRGLFSRELRGKSYIDVLRV